MKTSIPHTSQMYENKEHGRHTLYCGTEILQTRFYDHKPVLAIVVRTGFLTTKGTTLRTLLYPAPADYKFEKHSYMFVIVLACIAVFGFIYTIVSKVSCPIGSQQALVRLEISSSEKNVVRISIG